MSLPIMLGTLIQFAIFIVDAAFLGRLDSSIPFDAVGTAGLIILPLGSICHGIYYGTQILIANDLGKNERKIAPVFINTFFILLLLAAFCFLITLIISGNALDYMVESDELEVAMQQFLDVRAWGFWASIPGFVFLAFYTGIARTGFLIWISIVVASTNITLDYALIFGKWGLPEFGMLGAAYASNIAEFTGLGFAIVYIFFDKKAKQYLSTLKVKWDSSVVKRILKISTPLMIQGLIATFGWAVFFLLIEKIGIVELEISQVLRNIYYISLIPIIAFGSATKTYVSNFLSHKAGKAIMLQLIKRLSILSVGFMIALTVIFVLFPNGTLSMITNKQEIIEQCIPILIFLCGAMILFSFTYLTLSVIAGAGKTWQAMLIEITAIVIYLSFCYYVTVVNYTSMIAVWSSEYIYFVLLGVISIGYLYRTKLLAQHGE